MGIHVISTYGRTETSGIVTSRNMYDYSNTPQLGAPVGCNEVKLVDDTENGYSCSDEPNPRGEVRRGRKNTLREIILRSCYCSFFFFFKQS